MYRVLLPALLLAGCGGASPPAAAPTSPAPSESLPQLLGRSIWEGPLMDATATRLLDRVRATLEVPVPVLKGSDPSAWRAPITTWLDERVAAATAIRADVEGLAEHDDPRMKLLAAIALGVATDDLIGDITAIQLPPEVRESEYGADIERVVREALEERALPLVETARMAFERCGALAGKTTAVLQGWGSYCGERVTSLAAFAERVGARVASRPAPKVSPRPPALFGDCETNEQIRSAPSALPPDRRVKPSVAFVYGDDVLQSSADIAKLEAAVAVKLGKKTRMPVVSGKELAAARKLVAQRKLHARGPSCGKAPPLTAVLAHQRKHLVVGEIATTCIYSGIVHDEPEACHLIVRYQRAGDDDDTGPPQAMFAPIGKNVDVPASDYIAAVERLAPVQQVAGVLGALMDGGSARAFFATSGHADEDPWLAVGRTLREDTAARLATCVDAAASFDATFTITREGKTTDVVLAPVTAPPAGSKVADCVKQALAATPWPCTRDGEPAAVSVRMCVAPKPQ